MDRYTEEQARGEAERIQQKVDSGFEIKAAGRFVEEENIGLLALELFDNDQLIRDYNEIDRYLDENLIVALHALIDNDLDRAKEFLPKAAKSGSESLRIDIALCVPHLTRYDIDTAKEVVVHLSEEDGRVLEELDESLMEIPVRDRIPLVKVILDASSSSAKT